MSDVSSSTGEAPAALPTAISWTGGKDSNLALLLAALDLRFDVAALVVFRPQNAAFRAHPLSFMHAQAASLALPLYEVEVGGSSTQEYRDSYVRGLQGLREQHGIAVVVTGDMDLMVGSTVNWMQDCCGAAGLRTYLPLWGADRAGLLAALLSERFRIVFSCLKSPWFTAEWIGRELDADGLAHLHKLTESEGMDLGGERGEYHTMCLDGPLYRYPLRLQSTQPHQLGQGTAGKPEGAAWWVLECEEVVAGEANTGPGGRAGKCHQRRDAIFAGLGNNGGRFV